VRSPPLTEAAAKILHDIEVLYRELQQCPKRDIDRASDLIQQIHTKSLAFAKLTVDLLVSFTVETRGGDRRSRRKPPSSKVRAGE